MISAYSAAAVRAAEQPLLAAGRGPELMRTAAHGLAMGVVSLLRSRGRGVYGATVALLVGSGNNGADTLYAGAYLAARGARVTALLSGSKTHAGALAAFRKAGGHRVCPSGAAGAAEFTATAGVSDVVVDGLLGTGGRGGLRDAAATVVDALGRLGGVARPLVVACDLPSGVDATTGEVHGPVLRADLTVTFGAHKSGLLNAPGEQLCGSVVLVDIGIADLLGEPNVLRLERTDVASLLPNPRAADHKYTRGVAGIIAGSEQYPGAGLLAAAAASACGPGMVRYLGPAGVAAALHLRNPEVVCSQDSPPDVRVQAWLAGPGIDGEASQLERAARVINAGPAANIPVVVDAAALALVRPADGSANAHLILTPHAGELATLFARAGVALDRAAVEAAPLAAARRGAAHFGAVVLLKGPSTVVAAPDGTTFTQANGTPRLATAGSGDTLAGILVALLAMGGAGGSGQGSLPAPAHLAATAALAAALHGELARSGAPGSAKPPSAEPGSAESLSAEPLNAGMLARRIPAVWAQLSAQS